MPVSLLIIIIDIRVVFGRIAFIIASTLIVPLYLDLIFVTVAVPYYSMLLIHRSMDGCSWAETIICLAVATALFFESIRAIRDAP